MADKVLLAVVNATSMAGDACVFVAPSGGRLPRAWVVKPAAPYETVFFEWPLDHIAYYLAFGTFAPGQLLSPEQWSSARAIVFPPGIIILTATVHPDGTWTLEPTVLP